MVGGSRGEKGKGERDEGAWWLVGYLPNLYLSPLIPYEMRYMSMIMSMNMNTNAYENVSLASSAVQYSLLGFFLLLYDR